MVLQKVIDFILRKIRVVFDLIALLIGLYYPKSTKQLPPITDSLLLEPAHKLATKIRTGKLKSETLVRAYIERCRKVQPYINAIVDDNFEEAVREAKRIDALVTRQLAGERLPNDESIDDMYFLGVPFTTKDSITVKGKSCTGGYVARKGVKGEADDTVIMRLKRAGAIFLAMTNVPEAVMWYSCSNRVYGTTNNPYDLNRIPGGSSGGEGAILSSAASVFGVGSDLGGSIRIPSFYCGLFGHKTSPGNVEVEGLNLALGQHRANHICIGPMCRYASDLRPILRVLCDNRLDLPEKPLNFSTLNVFYLQQMPDPLASPVDVEIKEGFDKLIKYFIQKGSCTLELDTRKKFYDLRFGMMLWTSGLHHPSNPNFFTLLAGGDRSKINGYWEFFKSMFGLNSRYTFPILFSALTEELGIASGELNKDANLKSLESLKTELHKLLAKNGCLIMPGLPEVAPKHNQDFFKMFHLAYTFPWNVLNVAVTSVPLGKDRHGMPFGVQVIVAPGNDNLSIQVAEELEKHFGGWTPPCQASTISSKQATMSTRSLSSSFGQAPSATSPSPSSTSSSASASTTAVNCAPQPTIVHQQTSTSSSSPPSASSSGTSSQHPSILMDNLNLSNNLSSSCSSLSSIASTMSQNSNSLANEFGVYLILYNSIEIISSRYKDDELYFKMAAFDMKTTTQNGPSNVFNDADESMGIGDEFDVELSIMNAQQHFYNRQSTEGRLVRQNELIMCRSRIPVTDEQFGIRVDLYRKVPISSPDDAPTIVYDKIAFCYIYPLDVGSSNGRCVMPITSKTGKIIARFKAEYFVAKPYQGLTNEIKIKSKIRNAKSWQLKKEGFDIGHRGAGVARRNDHSEKVLENTVDSFNYAYKKGADMVELDVQLSKDKIPIVYHDFNVNIHLQKKDKQTETFSINIGNLTFDQLQALKTKPVLKPGKEFYDFAQDSQDGFDMTQHNQPFASLRYVLESVVPDCGFNVEIKYPQKKINGQWESEKSHDVNEFVDLILQDLFLYAGDRNIIISSFHPEICSLVKLKQDRYPVLFLTQGLTQKWMAYENPLNHSIEMATYLAVSMGLYGIAVHAEDIINDRKLIRFVKSFPLVLFCWGDDLNNKALISQLKAEGVDGAIYDKIDLLVEKEIQPNCSPGCVTEPMEL